MATGTLLSVNLLCILISIQFKIVKACRELGLASGGFYQPGYRDGAKLHLKMMCLGKNWDPETGNYGDLRLIDCAVPPGIPREFYQLVERAIKDSLSLIQQEARASHIEDILPWMSPDICIVNFYSASGRLGLHQVQTLKLFFHPCSTQEIIESPCLGNSCLYVVATINSHTFFFANQYPTLSVLIESQ